MGCTKLGIIPRSRAFWLKKMGLLNLVKNVLRADAMSFFQGGRWTFLGGRWTKGKTKGNKVLLPLKAVGSP